MPHRRLLKMAFMAASFGVDRASQPDRTAYWPNQPKTPDPKKRAKVKAARKQRKAKP